MKYVIIFALLIFTTDFAYCQSDNTKPDTLYYLLDTAKVSINDRIVKIVDASLFKFYYFECPCLDEGQMPYLIHRTKDLGEKIAYADIDKYKLIGTSSLLYLFHKNYLEFDSKHVIYILEVLPDRKIIKRLVKTGAMTLSSKI